MKGQNQLLVEGLKKSWDSIPSAVGVDDLSHRGRFS